MLLDSAKALLFTALRYFFEDCLCDCLKLCMMITMTKGFFHCRTE